MKYLTHAATIALSLALAAGAASAQQATSDSSHAHHARSATHRSSSQAALRAEAKIGADSARSLAMKEVPGGKIQSSELEREHGKLIYSYDIKVAGKSGIEEVNIDALTGALVAHEHETPTAEKKEAAQERKEGTTATKKTAKP